MFMKGILEWVNQEENKFFALHVAFILIAAVLVEIFLGGWTRIAYPAILLVSLASFMFNYPVSAVKDHGLFSEYLIELRILWLIVIGIFLEYVVYQVFEAKQVHLLGGLALVAGLVILFYSRSSLQEKITQARGFK